MTFYPQKQPYSSFENNSGPTNRQTDGPTDGHDLLQRCVVASKKEKGHFQRQALITLNTVNAIGDCSKIAFFVYALVRVHKENKIVMIKILKESSQLSNEKRQQKHSAADKAQGIRFLPLFFLFFSFFFLFFSFSFFTFFFINCPRISEDEADDMDIHSCGDAGGNRVFRSYGMSGITKIYFLIPFYLFLFLSVYDHHYHHSYRYFY